MNDLRAQLNSALGHHQAGDLVAAERIYRKVLKSQPGNADALYLMGTLAQQSGNLDAAATYLARAVKRNRRNPHFLTALGAARLAQGKANEAAACYRKALALKSDHAEACLGLGNVLQSQGRLDPAVAQYRRAIDADPALAEAHNNLGVALNAKGQVAGAIASFARAAELQPRYADAHLNLGQALKLEGRLDEAILSARRALELDPRLYEAHNNLGNALREAGQPEAAVEHYRKAIALRPGYAQAHNNLGIALGDLGRFDEALAAHRKALELDPGLADGHAALGATLQILGRLDEAEQQYRATLALDPDHARAHHNLAMVRAAEAGDEEIGRLESLLGKPGLIDKEAMNLRFALGKLCDDAGRFDDAFAHYGVANRLKRVELRQQGLGFDAAAHRAQVERIIATFDKAFFAGRAGFGAPSDRPVFIVGMPRSGTTLVEQILASHSQVFGAGELEQIGALVSPAPKPAGGPPYPDSAATLSEEALRRLGEDYLDYLGRLEPAAGRVTDKLPGNFLYLGMIAVMLPGARIIHCRRDGLDTCLSCYFQNFNRTLAFTYDLEDLALYHRGYLRLMAHWRDVLPRPVFEVDYQRLVADQEAVSRELVAFCGLDWDPACLDFHETERPVRTASLSQVRRPIYGSSVDRWRNYETHLAALKQSLEEPTFRDREP